MFPHHTLTVMYLFLSFYFQLIMLVFTCTFKCLQKQKNCTAEGRINILNDCLIDFCQAIKPIKPMIKWHSS